MNMLSTSSVLVTGLLLVACVAQPMGPTVAVMPAPNKPFSVFQEDQAICRQQRYDFAYEQCMYARGNQVPGYPIAVTPLPPQ